MIIELVGLPGSGKTTLAKELKTKGVIVIRVSSRVERIYGAILFWIMHPFLAVRLFIHLMMHAPHGIRYSLFMNGYVGYAAQYRRAQCLSQTGRVVVLDQGFFQLLISLGELSPSLLKSFPKPDLVVVVATETSVREERMASRGRVPREEWGTENRLAWQRNAEQSLERALPSLAELVCVYHYDGTQDPVQGASVLIQAHAIGQVTSDRRQLKTIVAIVSFLIARSVRIFKNSPEVMVLMYHAIDRSGWKLAVSPEDFERQIKYLSRKGCAMPLTEIVSYVKGERRFSSRAIAVTFDDGYKDILTTVLPILEQYQVPATVFIPSDFSARTDPSERERLTDEEVRTLSESPLITIGSHAKTHRKFTELSSEEMDIETRESTDVLERIAGKKIRFFAYPFGSRSAEAESKVKEAGYEAAFGITEGTLSPGDDLFRLKRVQIDGTMSFLLFRLRLTSALDWNRRIVDAFRATMSV